MNLKKFIFKEFCTIVEGVAPLSEDLHQVVSEVPSRQGSADGVGKSVSLVYGYCVGGTVTRIENDTWEKYLN